MGWCDRRIGIADVKGQLRGSESLGAGPFKVPSTHWLQGPSDGIMKKNCAGKSSDLGPVGSLRCWPFGEQRLDVEVVAHNSVLLLIGTVSTQLQS